MKVYNDRIVHLKLHDILSVVPTTEEGAVDWAVISRWDSETEAYANVRTFQRMNGDVPVFMPLTATGYSWTRKEYATSLARELGAQIAGLEFDEDCVNDDGQIPAFIIKVVMATGVMVDGKPMYLRYMTQAAKSNSAVLPLVDAEWGKAMNAWFPDAGDTVRPGALHSPLRGGCYRFTARVLVVEDDDKRYTMIGDGQGIVDPRKMGGLGVKFKDGPQFRAVMYMDRPWQKRALGKGTLYMASLPEGIDMVLPKSTIKANKNVKIVNGLANVDMIFGVMNGEGEKLAGPIYIGEQVWQWATSDITASADELVSGKLAELRTKVNDVAWLAERGYELRDEEGNLQQFEIIKLFAMICVVLGNTMLMRTKMVAEAMSEWVATIGIQTILGLGTYAWRFRAVCRRSLGDGWMAINPRVFKHLFGGVEGDVKTISVRYPFALRIEMIAVRVVADPRVRWYEVHVNEKTMNRAAADFDGDTLAILRPDKHVLRARKTVEDLPWTEEKVRQSATAPKRRSVMISQSMSAGVGLIDHVISVLVAVWHLLPDKRTQAMEYIGLARIELQKAVDSVKKAATADMTLVSTLSKWGKKLVRKSDYAYRKLRKDANLKPFMPFEGTADEAKLHSLVLTNGKQEDLFAPGRIIMPSAFLGPEQMVPLAAFVVRHEDEVPLVSNQTLPNKQFAKWLPVIAGPGHAWATDVITKFKKRLNEIGNDEDAGKINADKAKLLRTDLFSGYREVWKAKRVEMAEDKTWLESAASAVWADFTAGNGKGFALKFSIPEVIAEMLIVRKDKIKADGGQIGRIMGGKEFRAKYMTKDDEHLVVEVVPNPLKDGKLAIRVEGGIPHGIEDVVVPLGHYRVQVKMNGGVSPTILFTGDAVETGLDLPESELSEWVDDGAFDYGVLDEEYPDVDVM